MAKGMITVMLVQDDGTTRQALIFGGSRTRAVEKNIADRRVLARDHKDHASRWLNYDNMVFATSDSLARAGYKIGDLDIRVASE